ncbi:unnamed protein product [Cuscuta campestris]|uniref:Thioredoxin domain-containing protein n=1 Tax=Cuscuta campestris TaxID=132261 RepID=A0A484LL79_9ASTE|nr:unnamed protein product [Cuscuta campestris]
MQSQGVLAWKAPSPFGFARNILIHADKLGFVAGSILPTFRSCHMKAGGVFGRLPNAEIRCYDGVRSMQTVINGSVDGLFEDEDHEDCCPVDCVREFKREEEFARIMDKAKKTGSLVVVDFYRSSCGSCKYIEKGFSKLCKGSADQQSPVVFLKHNVLDEYDEQSEVAERLRIRTVPLFHLYKNGVLLEAFPTRDKERILSAILKYSSAPQKA